MLLEIFLIGVGFALLVAGGELLVQGAVGLAERLKVSAFVIGAVVIGFGSSTPELVTSIEAALRDAPGIAIGNIVGSNIINILVVLGIAAIIAPIALTGEHVRKDTIIVCALSALFVATSTVLELTPLVGATFLIALAVYLTYSIRREMYAASVSQVSAGGSTAAAVSSAPDTGSDNATDQSLPVAIGSVVAGFAVLVLGGHLVVDSAVTMAKLIGISETVIGLTIVAFGTSLPEIVTAVVAAFRRHADVALGNVLGSCIFNLLAIGGTIAIISPSEVPAEILRFDNFIMLAAALLLLAAVMLARNIGRGVGALFLGSYATYLTFMWP